MQTFLLRHGFDCQIINYKSPGFTKREYDCFIKLRFRMNLSLIKSNTINMRKIYEFRKAQSRLLLTRRIFTERGLSSLYFDRIVIGSDEVWNFGTKLIGYDPIYFSKGLKANRIISYAASFGSISTNEAVPKELQNSLGNIKYVSVRDDNSAKIMGTITNKDIQIVLDPTFLIDMKSEAVKPHARGYILIYGFFTERMKQQILKYAHSIGKRTLSVGYYIPWCDTSLVTLSPFKWLGYFMNCDCVITTMYHGMIYSILNQKEFCMFSTPYREYKVGNLLSNLGLSNRYVDENISIEDVFGEETNYSKVSLELEKKRNQSQHFLLRALQS